MSDINVPIQITSELNVPEPISETNTNKNSEQDEAKPAKSSSGEPPAERSSSKMLPKNRLRADNKSQSMFNFSTAAIRAAEDHLSANAANDREVPPEITLTLASAKFQKSNEQKSTASLNGNTEDTLLGEDVGKLHPISNSTNNMSFTAHRKRVNSLPVSEPIDDDEFDELDGNRVGGSQLRIRSSIISLFGRMGKNRRTSNISTNSGHDNNDNNDHRPPLRALPQIAATKILRAFSYVGKAPLSTGFELKFYFPNLLIQSFFFRIFRILNF